MVPIKKLISDCLYSYGLFGIYSWICLLLPKFSRIYSFIIITFCISEINFQNQSEQVILKRVQSYGCWVMSSAISTSFGQVSAPHSSTWLTPPLSLSPSRNNIATFHNKQERLYFLDIIVKIYWYDIHKIAVVYILSDVSRKVLRYFGLSTSDPYTFTSSGLMRPRAYHELATSTAVL